MLRLFPPSFELFSLLQVSKRAWWKNNKSKAAPPPSSFRVSSSSTTPPSARSSTSSDHGDGDRFVRRGSAQDVSTRIPEGVAVVPPPPQQQPESNEETTVADEEEDDEDDWIDGGKHSEISAATTTLPDPSSSPPPPPPSARPTTLGSLPSFSSSSDGPSSPTSPSESTVARSRRWSEKLTSSHSTNSLKGRPNPSGATSPTSSGSRPLAHTVLRSLPLGSMVNLEGQSNKKEDVRVARKLNEAASSESALSSSFLPSSNRTTNRGLCADSSLLFLRTFFPATINSVQRRSLFHRSWSLRSERHLHLLPHPIFLLLLRLQQRTLLQTSSLPLRSTIPPLFQPLLLLHPSSNHQPRPSYSRRRAIQQPRLGLR